ELLANRHQAGHFGLGDGNFLAPPVGEGKVGNLEVGEIPGVGHSVHQSLLVGDRAVGSSLVTPRASRGSTSAVAKSEVPRAWQGSAAKRVAVLLQRSSRRSAIIAQACALPMPGSGTTALVSARLPPASVPAMRPPGSTHACRSPRYGRSPPRQKARSRGDGKVRGSRCAGTS